MSIKDFYNELDLLRVEWLDRRIESKQYNTRIVEYITQISDYWQAQRAAGTADAKEMEQTKEKIGDLIQTQDSLGKVATLRALIGTDILDDKSYAAAFRLVSEYAFNRKEQLQENHQYDAPAKAVFVAALKEMSKLLDQVSPAQRKLILAEMDDKLAGLVVANLPAAQQLRIKQELIKVGRRLS